MKSKNRIKVLLAEDHATVRQGLRMIIDSQPDLEVVGEVADGAEALRRAQVLKPTVVVMDISMPGMNGLKATRQIRETLPEVRIVALTRHKEDGYVQELLRAGATGYVLKQSSSEELIRAVRAVGNGNSYLDPAITLAVTSKYQDSTLKTGTVGSTISDRETDVLRLIATGYSNKEIASLLMVSVKTVESHKANSMKKLGLAGRIDIVRYALLQGWLNSA